MICLARYSHKRDTSNLVSTDGSYGGAAFNPEQYDAEQAIAAAQQHLEQLEKNKLKKKPQASCVRERDRSGVVGATHLRHGVAQRRRVRPDPVGGRRVAVGTVWKSTGAGCTGALAGAATVLAPSSGEEPISATPSSRCRVDGVDVERAVKF